MSNVGIAMLSVLGLTAAVHIAAWLVAARRGRRLWRQPAALPLCIGVLVLLAIDAVMIITWEHPGRQPLLNFAVMLPWSVALGLVNAEVRTLRAGKRGR